MFGNALTTFAPWRDMARLHDELNRLFDNGRFSSRCEYPALNAYLEEDKAVITAEIPGIDPEKLDISVHDETLTIKGEVEAPELGKDEAVFRRERCWGSFSRSLTLPFRVEADKVNAECKNGVLTLTLPRAEEDKPRKIMIRAEDN